LRFGRAGFDAAPVDPAWLGPSLAAVMIATAAYHLARLSVPRVREPDVDLAHAAMGVAMAVMLLDPPSGQAAWRWAVPLAVGALWFACRGVHDYVMDGPRAAGHHTQQALVCAAMAYMSAVPALPVPAAALPAVSDSGMSMTGMGAAGQATLDRLVPALLIGALVGVAALTCTRVARSGGSGAPARAPAATATAGCQLAMIGTGVYMLAAML
jgi:hypothetical protein